MGAADRRTSGGGRRPVAAAPGRTISLTADRMAYEGRAVGRADGKVCFIWGALPGERVEVELEREHARFDEGRAIRLHTVSAHRVPPPCPQFGDCGGCHFLHCAYAEQLRFKKGFVEDALRLLPEARALIEETAPSSNPVFSRNRAAYGVQADSNGIRLGFHARRDPARIVSAEDCVLQSEPARALLRALRAALETIAPAEAEALFRVEIREGKNTDRRMAVLHAERDGPALRAAAEACRGACDSAVALLGRARRDSVPAVTRPRTLFGEGFIEETLDGLTFRIGPTAFFQTHTAVASALFRRVREEIGRANAGKPLELYAGSGVLAALAARPGGDWVGFEADTEAVKTARVNFERNGVSGARILARRIEELRPESLSGAHDLVVADPPRAGLSPVALRNLLALRIPRMIYISCQPAILARDLLDLTRQGGYRVDWVKPFDMFPQTTHVETAVGLSR